MLKSFSELDSGLWKGITKLYSSDPLTHVYLLYDLIYELGRTDACFEVVGGDIAGYLLVWRGPRVVCAHLWGKAGNLVDRIPCDAKAIVVVHDRRFLGRAIDFLKTKGGVEIEEYLDMVVDEESFRPYSAGRAVRLSAKDGHHVKEFLELTRVSGWGISEEKARELLAKRRYYGLFEEGELVSIACAFLRMPEVWPIGSVYTHPDYRGRGYAKTVTSAITRDALTSGAKALLHVAEDNISAIHVYKALGYKTISKKPWIFFNP